MKKQKEIFEYKASSKDYLLALTSFPSFTKKINIQGHSCQKMLEYFVNNERHFLNEDSQIPTMKELSSILNINVNRLSAQLKLIYDEILELNFNKPQIFTKDDEIPCLLSFKYFDSYQTFNLGLKVVPRKSESFNFYFIKPRLGAASFHVERVYHDYENDGHSILLTLSPRYPNQYMELLKEKAYLRRDISFSELIMVDWDSSFEDKILKWNPNL